MIINVKKIRERERGGGQQNNISYELVRDQGAGVTKGDEKQSYLPL
jgi:hypothetical protein